MCARMALERIVSAVSRNEALKDNQSEAPEEKQPTEELERRNSDGISVDGDDGDNTFEASEQLFRQLTSEQQQQQQQQQRVTRAADEGEGKQALLEDEEERMASMEIDFQNRVTLDDIGKEGLSPEHAASELNCLCKNTCTDMPTGWQSDKQEDTREGRSTDTNEGRSYRRVSVIVRSQFRSQKVNRQAFVGFEAYLQLFGVC